MAAYTICAVTDRRMLRMFIGFPDELYRNCPQYVPALHHDQKRTLTKSAPLEYCRMKMWVAMENGKVVGRICAIVNPRYNERYGTRRARFGWFDVIDDFEVARLLVDTASAWAKGEGMTEIHGPLFFNTLGKQGMLVEGYENTPPFNCIYNFPYYVDFVERLGFEKECDWVQFRLPVLQDLPGKTTRMAGIVKERYGLRFGNLDLIKKDKKQVNDFFRVYNEAFASRVYNFIPFTELEIKEEARASIPLLSEKSSSVVLDRDGNLAAFGIVFPSMSKALQKARGRLFPSGWWFLLRARKDYSVIDLMLTGAVPEWQNKGLSALFFDAIMAKARKNGSAWAITNPQIEDNPAVNLWNSYEHELFMRRRCYIKKIE